MKGSPERFPFSITSSLGTSTTTSHSSVNVFPIFGVNFNWRFQRHSRNQMTSGVFHCAFLEGSWIVLIAYISVLCSLAAIMSDFSFRDG